MIFRVLSAFSTIQGMLPAGWGGRSGPGADSGSHMLHPGSRGAAAVPRAGQPVQGRALRAAARVPLPGKGVFGADLAAAGGKIALHRTPGGHCMPNIKYVEDAVSSMSRHNFCPFHLLPKAYHSHPERCSS